jgi:hypothetical protein
MAKKSEGSLTGSDSRTFLKFLGVPVLGAALPLDLSRAFTVCDNDLCSLMGRPIRTAITCGRDGSATLTPQADRFAGHLESGEDSISDPMMGGLL